VLSRSLLVAATVAKTMPQARPKLALYAQ
jgi:hypothetical protein